MRMKIRVIEINQTLGNDIKLADTIIQRLKGLMFQRHMSGYDGLMIRPCNSIHTFFMCYNIDVVFLDREFKIIKIIRDLRPWRMTMVYFNAYQVLELLGGTLSQDATEGQKLEVLCLN